MRKLIPLLSVIVFLSAECFLTTANGNDKIRSLKVREPVTFNAVAASKKWTVPELCAAYKFPKNLAGGGVIGIAEYGGGYFKTDLDLFSNTYMNGTPINISDVNVDGTVNSPGLYYGEDAEVALDIQIAAAAYYYSTGKAPTIKMFFAGKNVVTTDDFINANTQVIKAAAAAGCDVLSISWGLGEDTVLNSTALNLEAAATAAAGTAGGTKGMMIFAASGDGDATNERQGYIDRKNHLILPSSAPHVIAVGGTTKTLATETVWNNGYSLGTSYPLGTGGGYSVVFPTQSWQIGAPIAPATNNGKGRMVPDVAANADPNTPYYIALYGFIQAAGNGTSAATPLWAGLCSSMTKGQKIGFIGPSLWATANRKAYTDIIQGNNILFSAGIGPDACTGLGVPIGSSIASVIVPPPPSPPPVVIPSNVTATFANGTLTITGDANPNSLTVSMQAGTISVLGANGTKINNSASAFTASSSGGLTLSVDLGAGNDSIQFVGVGATSGSVLLGVGNDSAAFTLCNVKTLTIDGGTGTNVLLTTSSTFGTLTATNFSN
jgi:hypothetical protein